MFRLSRAKRQSRAIVSGAAWPGLSPRCCWCSFVRLETGLFPSLAFVGPLAAGLRIGPRLVVLTSALSAVCGVAPQRQVRLSSDPCTRSRLRNFRVPQSLLLVIPRPSSPFPRSRHRNFRVPVSAPQRQVRLSSGHCTRSRPFIQGVVITIINCRLSVSSVEDEAPEPSSCQWRRSARSGQHVGSPPDELRVQSRPLFSCLCLICSSLRLGHSESRCSLFSCAPASSLICSKPRRATLGLDCRSAVVGVRSFD